MPRRLEWICMLALILLSKNFKSCNGISNCHFQETKSKFGQILNKILRYQNSFPDFLARKKIISFQIQNHFRVKNWCTDWKLDFCQKILWYTTNKSKTSKVTNLPNLQRKRNSNLYYLTEKCYSDFSSKFTSKLELNYD